MKTGIAVMLDKSGQPEQCPEDILVIRCQTRDECAFRELVRRWEPRLYYYLRRLVEDESAIWDVLQNTWLAVFRHLPRLENARKFRSWVYRIAHDQAVNWLKKERRYVSQADEQIGPLAEDEESISLPSEDAALIHQALQKLSPQHCEVLTLFYLEGFSAPQIAEIVGLPGGTVKSRLHNARQNLAQALKEVGYERNR
jgi:RNA polymerase sigma-70 factor, ECF subfamily